MDSKQQTEQTIQTIRLRFARQEPAIWLAHLDMMRTFERAIRRAGLPVAYSKGFNPRPQLAFALPIGVGLATRDDYVDVNLTEPVAPAELIVRLNRTLPEGLERLAAKVIADEGSSLMSKVRAADYQLSGQGLADAAARLLATPEDAQWLTEKNSKGKMISIDIRPLLMNLTADAPDRITVRVRAGSRENLRPDLLLGAMVQYAGLDPIAAADTAITRLNLLIPAESDPGALVCPMPLHDGN